MKNCGPKPRKGKGMEREGRDGGQEMEGKVVKNGMEGNDSKKEQEIE